MLSHLGLSIDGIIGTATMLTSRFKNKQKSKLYQCLNTLGKKGCLFYSKLGSHSTRSLLSPRTELFLLASAEELKKLFRMALSQEPRSLPGRRWEVSALTLSRSSSLLAGSGVASGGAGGGGQASQWPFLSQLPHLPNRAV